MLPPPVAPQPTIGDVDQALKARLDKLAAARTGSGRSQVPPTARTNAPVKKRRHPAKHSRAAALTLSVLASGGLAFQFAKSDQGLSASPVAAAGIVTSPTPLATVTPTAAVAVATPSTQPTPAAIAAPVAQLPSAPAAPVASTPATLPAVAVPVEVIVDTPVTINGDSLPTKWGDVQVQATFAADGTLTDVTILQVPVGDSKSKRINDRAVPKLTSEALAAQSANIDTVSGATYTSIGYKKSLQSAIDIAVANGITTVAATK